jgi:hypothetical protein
MGKLTRLHYTDLDDLIANRGEDWMFETLMEGSRRGMTLKEIADGLGLKWWVFREWVESNCADKVGLADRERAEELEKRSSNQIETADGDTLAVDKFKVDQWMKLAGKLDRDRYGDKFEMKTTNTHTFDIRGLLAQREARLEAIGSEVVVDVPMVMPANNVEV